MPSPAAGITALVTFFIGFLPSLASLFPRLTAEFIVIVRPAGTVASSSQLAPNDGPGRHRGR